MASKTSTTAAAPAGATPAKRFELPALDLKLGSLTDGTDIPPPLPSPVQEKTAPTPPDTPDATQKQKQKSGDAAKGTSDAASPNSQLSNISVAGTKRRVEDSPASPTLSNRPGSIRRLFSRSLLNPAHANGNESVADGRPQSRSGSSVADSKKAKRSSWFGRLWSDDSGAGKPATPLSPPATDEKKPTGPPPPTIPELSELNTKLGIQNDSSFDGDLFKNIK